MIGAPKQGLRMTKPIARDPIYRGRVFDAEIIELCVRWYITYLWGANSQSSGDGSFE